MCDCVSEFHNARPQKECLPDFGTVVWLLWLGLCQLRFVVLQSLAKFKNKCGHVKIILRFIQYVEPVFRRHLSAEPAQSRKAQVILPIGAHLV